MTNYIVDYIQHLNNRGCSPRTTRTYEKTLNRFVDYCQVTSPGTISRATITKFRERLAHLSPKSTNANLSIIRSFLVFLSSRDITSLSPNKIELARIPFRLPNLPDPATFKLLPATNLRDQAIVAVLSTSGIRVSELTSLFRQQFTPPTTKFTILGKGYKQRLVFITQAASDILQAYLATRTDADPNVFVSAGIRPTRLTTRTVQRIITRLSPPDTHITPHTLRHIFATKLMNGGMPLRSIQTILGHSSIATTQIYMHVSNPKMADEYNQVVL